MTIKITTENCDHRNFNLVEESADSVIHIKLELPRVITSQSRKVLIDSLKVLIQTELSKFKWIIIGSVNIDFTWYLNDVERQETDKVGDIDNITKPIQDALCGPAGILIDDSQIGALYMYWMTRNDLIQDNVLKISLRFNNDYALYKEHLTFVQYTGAVCTPLAIDMTKHNQLLGMKIAIKQRLKLRKLGKTIKKAGFTGERFFVLSPYDFHRTRINGFSIISLEDFNKKCRDAGVSFLDILKFYRRATKTDIETEDKHGA